MLCPPTPFGIPSSLTLHVMLIHFLGTFLRTGIASGQLNARKTVPFVRNSTTHLRPLCLFDSE